MFYQIFLSTQVKRWAIIAYKHGIYELPHELPNDLRVTDLRKLGNIRKVSKFYRTIALSPVPPANEGFVNTSRKLLESKNETFPILRSFTSKLELVSNIL